MMHLLFLLFINCFAARAQLISAAVAEDSCNATSCGNLGTNIPYPFVTSKACATSSSSSFLLSNCSSSAQFPPSWEAFTQTFPSDYVARLNSVGPTTVMALFSVDYSTFINLAWDSHLTSQPACSIPLPLPSLDSNFPSSIDLSRLANDTLSFSRNSVVLLFNCSKPASDYLLAEADSPWCRSYQSQCTLMAEYYTAGHQCIQLIPPQDDSELNIQLNLQQDMDDHGCTHFQFFVTKNSSNYDAKITEWSKATIQLQWTVLECWQCVLFNVGSCVLDSANHTFQTCTNCTYGADEQDPRYCNAFPPACHQTYIFGRFAICSRVFKIIVALVVIVGTFLISLALCCCCRRHVRQRRRAKRSIEIPTKFRKNSAWPPPRHDELSSGSNESLDDLDLDGLSERPMEYSYSSIASATESFTSMVGEGGFGVVFKGALDEQEIAVKVLEVRSKQSRRQFLNEVATIGRIHHVNVVRLLGFCTQQDELHAQMLVYEYVVNGSLDTWLFNSSSKRAGAQYGAEMMRKLEWAQRYRIALGVARGLAYLHEECRHRIVHCDIKPQNILLDACMCPKISDFGLARLMSRDESRVVTLAKGTPGYMAPEFWVGGNIHLTTKADVYSYGMVLLELVSGRRNFALGCRRFPAVAFEAAMGNDIDSIVDPRLQVVMPAAEELRLLMQQQVRTAVFVALWCIQEQPTSRPTMSEVVQYLEGVAAVSEQPPLPPIASSSPMQANHLDLSSTRLQLDLTQVSQGR